MVNLLGAARLCRFACEESYEDIFVFAIPKIWDFILPRECRAAGAAAP